MKGFLYGLLIGALVGIVSILAFQHYNKEESITIINNTITVTDSSSTIGAGILTAIDTTDSSQSWAWDENSGIPGVLSEIPMVSGKPKTVWSTEVPKPIPEVTESAHIRNFIASRVDTLDKSYIDTTETGVVTVDMRHIQDVKYSLFNNRFKIDNTYNFEITYPQQVTTYTEESRWHLGIYIGPSYGFGTNKTDITVGIGIGYAIF